MTDARKIESEEQVDLWPTGEQLKKFFMEQGRSESVASTFARVISESNSDLATILEHGLTEKEIDGFLEMVGIKPKDVEIGIARIQKLFSPEH